MRANAGEPRERQRALADLCQSYWPPVYAFIRSRGYSPHDAEDLTQGFFEQFISRKDFEKVDAGKGRLRSYMLGAAKNYLCGEHRRSRRQKRGGDVLVLSIDAAEAESRCLKIEVGDEATAEGIFQRQWATTVMENAVRRVEARYREEGKEDLFNVAKTLIMPGTETPKQAELARRVGLSPEAFRASSGDRGCRSNLPAD